MTKDEARKEMTSDEHTWGAEAKRKKQRFMLCHAKALKASTTFIHTRQSLSTSGLALGAAFPAVATLELPPVVVVTAPGFVAIPDPDVGVCNVPGEEKLINCNFLQLYGC